MSTSSSKITASSFKSFKEAVGGGFSGLQEDFPQFKLRVKLFARGIGVADHLEHDSKQVNNQVVTDEEWKLVDSLFMGSIILALDQITTQQALENFTSTKSVWDYLIHLHEQQDESEANDLQVQLLDFKIHVDDDIQVKVFELRTLYSNWARVAGEALKVSKFTSILHRALWKSIQDDIDAEVRNRSHQVANNMKHASGQPIVSHTIDEIVLHVVKKVKKEQSASKNHGPSAKSSSASAYHASTSTSGKCVLCPAPLNNNHDTKACPHLVKCQSIVADITGTTCSYCKGAAHSSRDCEKRSKRQFRFNKGHNNNKSNSASVANSASTSVSTSNKSATSN